MRTNNFHKLLDEEMRGTPPLPPQIKNNVQGNMRLFQFVGKMIELYLPRAIDTLVSVLSGSSDNNKMPPPRRKDPASPDQ